jgi:FtsP/CotA-like multicopper oxidase with cupredoxin domain
MFQEQTGLYGAIVIEPKGGYAQAFDRDYVVLLSDWGFEPPETIISNLKFQSDYYNYGQRTLGTFIEDAEKKGLAATIADRLEWGKMRMSPTDILDVTGVTYTYLINGQPPAANWTGLFGAGERVRVRLRLRLRFINGSSMSIFDVRIDGLPMTVVQADGNDVEPVAVDEIRISVAESYDVIAHPTADRRGSQRLCPRHVGAAPGHGGVANSADGSPADAYHGRYGHGWHRPWLDVQDGHGVKGQHVDGPRLDAAPSDAADGPQRDARHEDG